MKMKGSEPLDSGRYLEFMVDPKRFAAFRRIPGNGHTAPNALRLGKRGWCPGKREWCLGKREWGNKQIINRTLANVNGR